MKKARDRHLQRLLPQGDSSLCIHFRRTERDGAGRAGIRVFEVDEHARVLVCALHMDIGGAFAPGAGAAAVQ